MPVFVTENGTVIFVTEDSHFELGTEDGSALVGGATGGGVPLAIRYAEWENDPHQRRSAANSSSYGRAAMMSYMRK